MIFWPSVQKWLVGLVRRRKTALHYIKKEMRKFVGVNVEVEELEL